MGTCGVGGSWVQHRVVTLNSSSRNKREGAEHGTKGQAETKRVTRRGKRGKLEGAMGKMQRNGKGGRQLGWGKARTKQSDEQGKSGDYGYEKRQESDSVLSRAVYN